MIDIVTGAPLDDPYAGSSFTGLACDAEGEFSRGNNNGALYRSFGRLSRVSYDGWSQLLVVRPLAAITAARNISYLFGESSWNSSEIWVGRDGVSQFSYRTVGGGSLSVNAGPYTVGKRYVLVGVSRTTGTEFWINGKLVGTTTSVYGNPGYIRNLALFSADATANRMRYIGGAAWARALRQSEAAALSENPWQIFRPRTRRIFVSQGAGGSTLNALASGQSQASGTAQLAAQVALAGIGVAVAGGQAAATVAVPLAAAGIAVAGGQANARATVAITAAGLAQAAASAGLSASVLLAGAGAAQAAGNGHLTALLEMLAAGAAEASGSAQLSGGAQGDISASGQASAGGAGVLTVTVSLSAAGVSQASGTASGSAGSPGDVSAAGGAVADGSANITATVLLTAAGFVQAMGAGELVTTVSLAATGGALATGTGTLNVQGTVIYTRAPAGAGPQIILPAARRRVQSVTTTRPRNVGGTRH